MRRLVAIPVKSVAVVALWFIGVLCVAAEVRQPGFWCDKVDALKRSGDRGIGGSGDHPSPPKPGGLGTPGDLKTKTTKDDNRALIPQNPEPAYQNNEVAAEEQASDLPEVDSSEKTEDAHTRQIVISIPDRKLALLVDGAVVKVYPVAVGTRHTPSPEGEYTIINHAVNPVYSHDDVEIGPGKDNPLGTRWMGLSLKGYGIHGTNVQSSVGKAASHGCFRMKKKDVEDLYARVQVGDAVSIRGERDELTAGLFGAAADSVVARKDVVAGKDLSSATVTASKAETEVAASTVVVGGGQ